ncbi:MAG: hypothetical protein GFGODING_01268 [Flavobacteriales bacterium]|nr:hypothetical protein [Flavobacteriales bacterium]
MFPAASVIVIVAVKDPLTVVPGGGSCTTVNALQSEKVMLSTRFGITAAQPAPAGSITGSDNGQ